MNLLPKMAKTLAGVALGATILLGATRQADAAIVWTIVEANNAPNIGSQFSVAISEVAGRVQFEFKNNVGVTSSITDIYFDDKNSSVLSLPMTVFNSAGANFQQCDVGTQNCADPNNLPGGRTVQFQADFGTHPNNTPNGLNAASEFVRITFNYAANKTFANVVSEMNAGELVLGVRVQGLSGNRSQSYITSGGPSPTVVPEPATLALFGVGLAGIGLVRRRRATG